MKLKNKFSFRLLSLFTLLQTTAFADVSGKVFKDLPVNGTVVNTYGVFDTNEFGIGGVRVTAYPGGTTTTTSSDGSWSLATSSDVRIEFSNIPSYFQESVNGGVKNSSVQFVANGGTANFALHNPDDYVTENTSILAVTNIAGNKDNESDNPTLRVFTYAESTYTNDEANVKNVSTVGTTGATWGLAYDNVTKKAYASALLRRHVDVGPEGLGAIYVTDLTDINNPSTTLFTKVDNPGTEPTNRGLAGPNTASHDTNALAPIAKVGLGDIDLSEDRQKLYTINLNTQELVEIDVATKAQITYSIDNPFGNNCADNDVHSWAVEPHNGAVYVGSVCSSDPSVGAAVSKLDNGTFSTVFTTSLTYDRGNTISWMDTSKADWKAWNSTLNNGQFDVAPNSAKRFEDAKVAQPILSDIVFTENSGMVLGFIDRTSLMTGYRQLKPDTSDDSTVYEYDAGGDTLRVCNVGNGYVLEGEVGCDTHDGYDGKKEYFIGDFYAKDSSDDRTHDEISLGGLLYKQGSNAIATSTYDPVNYQDSDGYNCSGVTFFSMGDGDHTGGQLLNGGGTAVGTMGGFGKTGGMGDIELLSDPAPIEVGDRIWEDTDSDGVQDADEEGISDVTVELVCGGVVASTATTDADGNYIFSNDPSGTSTASHKYNVTVLVAGTNDCLVRVPNVSGANKQASLGSRILTVVDNGEGSKANNNDSDGLLNGDSAEATILAVDIPVNGANNHSFDFGFTLLTLGNRVWNDKNRNGIQDYGESGIKGVIVELYDNGSCDGNSIADVNTSYMGHYKFTGLAPSTYCIKVTKPSDWSFTSVNEVDSNGDNNDSKDSDVDVNSGLIENIVLNQNDKTEDIGIYHTECGLGTLGLGNIGDGKDYHDRNSSNADTTLYWNRRGTYGRWDFPTFEALGYCLEHDDSRPSVGDTGTTNSNPRNNLSDERRIYIQRATSALGDLDMIDVVLNEFPSSSSMMDLSIQEVIWYYADYEENLSAVDAQIDDTAYYSDSDRVKVKKILRLIIDRVEGKNGENQYPISDVTWVYTSDSDHQDIVVPSVFILPKPNMLCNEIGDRIWTENDANGVADDAGDDTTPVVGFDVNVTNGNILYLTKTDNNGLYKVLVPSNYDYNVTTGIPDGFEQSPIKVAGTDNDPTSNNNENHDSNGSIVALGTVDNHTIDFGFTTPVAPRYSLGDKVWKDDNKDGIQDANESGVANVTVKLYDNATCTGTDINSTTTDANGLYGFTNLLADTYCIAFSNLPAEYSISPKDNGDDAKDSDADNNGTIQNINLTANDPQEDMGIYPEVIEYQYASIGNRVWNDLNRDGVQDLNESGMEDVTVTLYGSDCTTKITSMQTVENGNYLFSNLLANTYCIGVEVPNGYAITLQDSTNDADDSDINRETNRTIPVTLELGENDIRWDAGMYQLSSLGDFVWYDDIKNGAQDENETGVANIDVTLYTDCNTTRKVIKKTITDNNGFYLFSNLEPNDDYCIGFENLPDGYQFTVDSDSNLSDTLECIVDTSTGITQNINLPVATNDLIWDMGIIPKCLDEEGRHLEIHDDEIVANTIGSVTTIDVLANDFGNLDIESIKFIKTTEGKILHSNGTAVAGTSIETYDTLVVPNEGTWRVTSDGKITFTSQAGFSGVPSPVYYIVQCKQGTISNVAQASITSSCVCETYEEQSISAMNSYGMLLLLMITSTFAFILFRKEFENKL